MLTLVLEEALEEREPWTDSERPAWLEGGLGGGLKGGLGVSGCSTTIFGSVSSEPWLSTEVWGGDEPDDELEPDERDELDSSDDWEKPLDKLLGWSEFSWPGELDLGEVCYAYRWLSQKWSLNIYSPNKQAILWVVLVGSGCDSGGATDIMI